MARDKEKGLWSNGWIATCPTCNKQWTCSHFECPNCHNHGSIWAFRNVDEYHDDETNGAAWELRCRRCGVSTDTVTCPQDDAGIFGKNLKASVEGAMPILSWPFLIMAMLVYVVLALGVTVGIIVAFNGNFAWFFVGMLAAAGLFMPYLKLAEGIGEAILPHRVTHQEFLAPSLREKYRKRH